MSTPRQAPPTGLFGSSIGTNMLTAATAEIIGTFVLVYGGTAVAVAAVLDRPVAGPSYNSVATPLAFGLALLVVVASIGHVSGGHVNPAVTLGLAATGRFPWRYVPAYLLAQLTGALFAVPLLAVLNSGIRSLRSTADEHVDPDDVHTSAPEETDRTNPARTANPNRPPTTR